MKEHTDELHERYYKKFWALEQNSQALGGEVKDVFRKNILEEYITEYAIMHGGDRIENARKLYELDIKQDELIPRYKRRRWVFWKKRPNQAADQINREMLIEIQRFFNARELALERLIAALDKDSTPQPDEADQAAADKAPETTAGTNTAQSDPAREPERNKGQIPGQLSLDQIGNDPGTDNK